MISHLSHDKIQENGDFFILMSGERSAKRLWTVSEFIAFSLGLDIFLSRMSDSRYVTYFVSFERVTYRVEISTGTFYNQFCLTSSFYFESFEFLKIFLCRESF